MITGGILKKDRLVLASQSEEDAKLILMALAGKSSVIPSVPYGNPIKPSLENKSLVLIKQTHRNYTYEEVQNILKKIQSFGRIQHQTIQRFLRSERDMLDSRLTMFYPSKENSTLEITVAYNWITFSLDTDVFGNIFEAIKNAFAELDLPAIKIFSNNVDMVSIHHYALSGIYFRRMIIEQIADALIMHTLVEKKSREDFIIKLAAFAAKSVCYMAARQLCQNASETFSLDDDLNYNPLIGDKYFLKSVFASLDKLIETGTFQALKKDQAEKFQTVATEPAAIKKYNLDTTIRNIISLFSKEFAPEINHAFAK